MRILHCLLAALALTPSSLALAAETFDGCTYYFGELHAHSGYSTDGGSADLGNCPDDMCGNFADFFDTMRHAAGLDFGAISDHVNGSTIPAEAWPVIIDLVNESHDPHGGFVSLLAAEVVLEKADGTELGHKNYYFFGDAAELSSISFEDTSACDGLELCDDMWTAVADLDDAYGPLVFLPHHPAQEKPSVTKWGCHSEKYSPVVEIYSTHGNAREDPVLDPYDTSYWGTDTEYTVNEALAPDAFGYRLGIIGGTDLHDSWPGMICHLDPLHPSQIYGGSLTGLVLDESEGFDRMAVYRALKARRTYATTGPQIPVEFVALDDGGVTLGNVGDVVPPPTGDVTFRVSVPSHAAPYVLSVELYTSDRDEPGAAEVSEGVYEYTSDLLAPFFAYAIVTLDGGQWWADQGVMCRDGGEDTLEKVWTSPIWVEELDTVDDDEDGYSEADGDCDDLEDDVHPAAEETGNGIDDDCDGVVDEDTDLFDGDGDGYSPAEGDCDDEDPAVHPGAEEICDGVADNDCDGQPDPLDQDGDGDGYTPCGSAGGDPDCDDDDPGVHPGAEEWANGLDDDCDGLIDEGLDEECPDEECPGCEDCPQDGCQCDLRTHAPAAPIALLLSLCLIAWRRSRA